MLCYPTPCGATTSESLSTYLRASAGSLCALRCCSGVRGKAGLRCVGGNSLTLMCDVDGTTR